MADAEHREPLLTDDIRELLRLIAQGDIAEVLIRRGDAEVHVKRAIAQPQVLSMVAAAPPVVVPNQGYLPNGVVTPLTSLPGEQEVPATTGVTVTAPMVGIYYSAPSPKEPTYVHLGDEVHPGDILGIIEAMKIMNEIECEMHGRVTNVLVTNGQPVEYGQPLLVIEPI